MMTEQQTIDFLTSLPLKKLRERQELIKLQMQTAYEHNNEAALIRLQQWLEDTDYVIDIKKFGKDKYNNFGII